MNIKKHYKLNMFDLNGKWAGAAIYTSKIEAENNLQGRLATQASLWSSLSIEEVYEFDRRHECNQLQLKVNELQAKLNSHNVS